MAFLKEESCEIGAFLCGNLGTFSTSTDKNAFEQKVSKEEDVVVVFFLMEESKYYFAEMIFFSFNFSFYLYNSQKSCKDQSCPYVGLIEVFNFCFYNFFFVTRTQNDEENHLCRKNRLVFQKT